MLAIMDIVTEFTTNVEKRERFDIIFDIMMSYSDLIQKNPIKYMFKSGTTV